jgi:hypothetical protein
MLVRPEWRSRRSGRIPCSPDFQGIDQHARAQDADVLKMNRYRGAENYPAR